MSNWQKPWGDPEHAGGIVWPILLGKPFRIPQEELGNVAGERNVWNILPNLLPPQPEALSNVTGQHHSDWDQKPTLLMP